MRYRADIRDSGREHKLMAKSNLIPGGHKLTLAEQSAGGKASAEARRKKKSMQELAKLMAAAPVTRKADKKLLQSVGITDPDMTQDALVTAALLSQALQGDTKAISMWQELTSEEVDNKLELLKDLLGNIGKIN